MKNLIYGMLFGLSLISAQSANAKISVSKGKDTTRDVASIGTENTRGPVVGVFSHAKVVSVTFNSVRGVVVMLREDDPTTPALFINFSGKDQALGGYFMGAIGKRVDFRAAEGTLTDFTVAE